MKKTKNCFYKLANEIKKTEKLQYIFRLSYMIPSAMILQSVYEGLKVFNNYSLIH